MMAIGGVLCKTGENEQAFRGESYTQNDTAELTLEGQPVGRAELTSDEPGCRRTRARVWSSRVKDPSRSRRVRFVRFAGRSHASPARGAAPRPVVCSRCLFVSNNVLQLGMPRHAATPIPSNMRTKCARMGREARSDLCIIGDRFEMRPWRRSLLACIIAMCI